MGRYVDRKFVVFTVHSCYLDRKSHHFYCSCFKCKHLSNLLHEMDRWSFYDLNQRRNKWLLIFHKKKFDSQVTLFPVFI